MTRAFIVTLACALFPIAATAQDGSGAAPDLSAAQISQGPMTVERIHNGFLAAPDFKFTEANHQNLWLAGGYAGVVFADAFFIGGGGYGTVYNNSTHDNSHGNDLAYGGLIMQWFGRTNETFGFGAKMLIGGGTSETTQLVQTVDHGHSITQSVRFHEDFLVFEPELNAHIRVAKHVRVQGGIGYRFTGHGYYDYYYGYPDHHGPDGVVGSFGVQIGGGS